MDLCPREVERLNDDRAGRTLEAMFNALASELTVTVVRQVIDAFRINLDELHNDSTSVSFYGAYDQAQEERPVRGQQTLAITYGHSKDHRPELKQLLFIISTTNEAQMNLDAGNVEIVDAQSTFLEAGGKDLGVGGDPTNNFGIGRLVIGKVGNPTMTFVTDLVNNGNRGGSKEALYLLGFGGPDGLEFRKSFCHFTFDDASRFR